QVGPGVSNSFTTHGNGSTQCALAATGTACREVPDVSANADGFTPYAEFCTGNSSTPGSLCAMFHGQVPGWIAGAGTSLLATVWAVIAPDRDISYYGVRPWT